MAIHHRPLVLIHGLWNSPRLFFNLEKELKPYGYSLFIPDLPHALGRISLRQLAKDLDKQIF